MQEGDKVKVIKPNLQTFGERGIVVGCWDDKVDVSLSCGKIVTYNEKSLEVVSSRTKKSVDGPIHVALIYLAVDDNPPTSLEELVSDEWDTCSPEVVCVGTMDEIRDEINTYLMETAEEVEDHFVIIDREIFVPSMTFSLEKVGE